MLRLPIRGYPRTHDQGFTYIGLLFLVVIVGMALTLGSEVWSTNRQREKEQELLFIGHQYRDAIMRYYEQSPFGEKTFPKSLDDLLLDPRNPGVRRYLRKMYEDPMTGKNDWGLVISELGGIQGVYSASMSRTIKSSNFDETDQDFEGKNFYAEWKFSYIPHTTLNAPSSVDENTEMNGEQNPPAPQEPAE